MRRNLGAAILTAALAAAAAVYADRARAEDPNAAPTVRVIGPTGTVWDPAAAGGGGGGTVSQGAPAAQNTTNAWPVFAYQGGGAWSITGTVTANLGTLNGAALDASVQQVRTTLGTPFQAGGSIGNTAFGISGTLPAFAAIPTFKFDQTTPGVTNAIANTAFDSVAALWRPLGVDARGAFIPPNAGTANRQITKCSIAATSATLTCTINNGTAVSSPAGICPAVTNAVTTEIASTVALVGLGLNGQTLTTGTVGTGTGAPDLPIPMANSLYTMPVGATNAITAYNPGASAAITTCIQTLRQ